MIKPVCLENQGVMEGIEALALGVFDGVHRGHQKIFETLLWNQDPQGAAVATFEPHPMRVVAPKHEPRRLMTLSQKIQSIYALGVRHVLVWAFDSAMRHLSAEEFVVRVAKVFPNLRRVVVGENWRFGFNAEGDAGILARLGATYEWRVEVVPPVLDANGGRISSSRIRELVEAGRIEEAEELLGRRFCLRGRVVRGTGRGKKIGFATANMEFDRAQWPPFGVYAAVASLGERDYLCVVNIGVRPTVNAMGRLSEASFEAHLLDYGGESLYGMEIDFWGLRWIRNEMKFDSLEALGQRIACDVACAREIYPEFAR
jgi:riboflavin kinase/FMN adenylyltransferase